MSFTFRRALLRAATIVELAKGLGESNRLCVDVYEEMDACFDLFRNSGIIIPYKTTASQQCYFRWMKPAVQEFTIQTMSILRYHEDADELMKYLLKTRIATSLDEKAVVRAHQLVADYAVAFDLDANGFPKKRVPFNTPFDLYSDRRLAKFNYVFVDSLDEFYNTPIPASSTPTSWSIEANSADFQRNMMKQNIMLAY